METKIDLSPQELRYSTYEIVYRAYEDYMYVINLSDHTRKAYLCNFRKYYTWCKEAGSRILESGYENKLEGFKRRVESQTMVRPLPTSHYGYKNNRRIPEQVHQQDRNQQVKVRL